jgi:hypothetical protein
MQKFTRSRLFPVVGLLLGTLVWLANSGNPPTGRTGAPFNGNCNDCHSGATYDGTVEIEGLPGVIDPDVTYDLSFKMTATVGSPSRGGFQIVVVDANDANCGDLIPIAGQGTGTENLQNREYIEQRNGKNFAAGMVSWAFQWKSPASVPGNTVKFYYIGNFCNGNGGSGGDKPIWSNVSVPFAGAPPLTAFISDVSNPTCNGGNNGSATVEASGGNPPYAYVWNNGQTTQTAVNLAAGTYTVTVTAVGGGGTVTASTTLSQPPVLNLSTSVSGTVTCVATATATATATGGTPNYSYEWSDGQLGSTAVFDQPGNYTVTVTDLNGCTRAASVNIAGNTAEPTAVANALGDITCLTTQTPLSGAGSSTGSNFSYMWTTADGNIVSGVNTLAPIVNACGTYTLLVTNTNNGCTASASTQVVCNNTQPNASATGGTITCSAPDVTLTGSSTTPNVTFAWAGPGITPANQFLQNPTVAAPGNYSLTVTNTENGCTRVVSATVNEDTAQPTVSASVSGSLTCSVASVQLSLSSNAPNATFSWTGPNGFTSTQQNPTVSQPGEYVGTAINPSNGCQGSAPVTVAQNIAAPGANASAVGQINCLADTVQLLGSSPAAPAVSYQWTGPNFASSLQNPVADAAGNYVLTVTSSANGCTSTAAAAVILNQNPPFDSIVPPANLNCLNLSVQLNATPSSQGPEFVYVWTAKNGGHIVSGDSTLTPVVDSTGWYFLAITNLDNGCSSLDSVRVVQSVAISANISVVEQVRCHGESNGTASASATGGDGQFSFLWSNGDTAQIALNLTAGTYLFTVTDGEGCSAIATATIGEPAPLDPNASATGETQSNANDGTASADPIGGTSPYSYLWSNGETTQSIANLSPGIYTVSVLDSNNCAESEIVTVNAFGCALTANAQASHVTCFGAADGAVSIALVNAADPVQYNWSNGATGAAISGLAPGTYVVSILDGNGCEVVLSANVNSPALLSANATATAVTANGAQDGTASANPTGGTPGYGFLWSNGSTMQDITGLAPGTYTVTVTDANGCSSAQTVNVTGFNCNLSLSVSSSAPSCFGFANGQATAVPSNGSLPYTFQWSTGASTQTVTNIPAGSYTVTASDADGCEISQSITVSQPDQLLATVTNIQNVLCPGDNTGSATITVTGGTEPYTFFPSGTLMNLAVGNYGVTVTDSRGCSALANFSITATDSEAPTMVCPAEISICGGNIVSYPSATAFDNCALAGAPTLLSGPPSGSLFAEGITTIVFQAADTKGNVATCSFNIVVNWVPDILIDEIVNDVNGQGLGAISVTPVGSGGFTYAWNKNGQPFATTEDLTGLTAGEYALTVTDVNSCTSALAPITITNSVSTAEPGQTGFLRLWPNPAVAFIMLETVDIAVSSAQLFDFKGALVKTLTASDLAAEIPVGELPEGMYCLKAQLTDGRCVSLRFVKR